MQRRSLPDGTSFEALFAPKLEHPYLHAAREHPCRRLGEFHPANAWWLAELVLLAYVPDEEFVRGVLGRAGFTDVQVVEFGSTHALLADDIVAFRGTDDLHDLLTDLDAGLVPARDSGGHGRVHRGFQAALELVWSEVADRISGREVFFAGHSLGAALATLAGSRHPRTRAVYTYGSPRVGDAAFGDSLSAPIYRIVNNNDVVTRLPPPLGYRHVGELQYLDDGGELRRDPELLERMREQLRGHGARLKDNLRRWLAGDLDALPYDSLIDHSPVHYAVHLANNLAD